MSTPTVTTMPCLIPEGATIDCEPEVASESGTVLKLKPSYAMIKPEDQVQFRVYLVNENGKEKQVTGGVKYTSAGLNIAQVGSDSGLAYGVAEGVTNVSAEWQGMTASAIIEVAECASKTIGIAVVIDNSISMSQPFNVGPLAIGELAFANKLNLAKSMASLFLSEVIWSKDYAGVISFNEGAQKRSSLTNDEDEASAAVASIAISSQMTDIAAGLTEAKDMLNEMASDLDKKVIVLFSDGFDNAGEDPDLLAQELKNQGFIIVSVAIRAHGEAFTRMHNIGTYGMFINAHQTSSVNLRSYVRKIKEYFCAGICTPVASGETVNAGELNYTGFTNWDVADGKNVDLIGGSGDYHFYDFLPGNGLYVDMIGSTAGEVQGKISSKATLISITAGYTYKVSFYLAGNQRDNRIGDKLRVTVTRSTEGDELDAEITINDWQQDFTLYEYEFTAAGTGDVILAFEQTEIGQNGMEWAGILLDAVTVEEDAGGGYAEVLSDDFDTENETTYSTESYNAVGLCMSEPIAEQYTDPNKLEDQEACIYGGKVSETDDPDDVSLEEGDDEEEEPEPEASCDQSYTADIGCGDSGDEFFTAFSGCNTSSGSADFWDGTLWNFVGCSWINNVKTKFTVTPAGGGYTAYANVTVIWYQRVIVTGEYDGPAWVMRIQENSGSNLWAAYKPTGTTPLGTYNSVSFIDLDGNNPGVNTFTPCATGPSSLTFAEA